MRYIASVSFGNDSNAMLSWLIKNNMPLDEVVFYNDGMQFQAIYDLRDNWLPLLKEQGIKYTELKPDCSFLYKMFDKEVNVGKGNEHKGYSWCGGCCRWGTTDKLKALDTYAKQNNAMVYVGIAFDEKERAKKEWKPYKIYPLIEWEKTEQDCLNFNYNNAFFYEENGIRLYDILDRVSCWCCSNKNHWELYNYWKYLPQYWQKLKELQSKTDRPFKKPYSVFDLEKRFENGYIPNHRRSNEKIFKKLP